MLRAGFEAHHTRVDLVAQAFPQLNALTIVSEAPLVLSGPHLGAVLELLFHAIADPGDAVLVPTPSYAGFWADLETRDDLTIVPGGVDRVAAHRYLGSVRRYEIVRSDGTTVQAEVPASTPMLPIGAPCTVEVIAGHRLHRLP